MGTISEEILRIQGAKASLKTAIESKGVEVSDSALIDEYADYVDDIQQGGGGGTPIAESVDVSDYTGGTTFNLLSQITDVNFPSGVTRIGDYAFYYCSGLTSITIPNSVTLIGSLAFYGCTGLTSFTIPDTVTYIGSNMLQGATNITYLKIGSGIETISTNNFANLNITTLVLSEGLKSIQTNAFESIKITSLTIPNSVTSISSGSCFRNNTNLSTITVGSNNTVYDSRNNCNAIIKTSNNELVVGCKSTVIPNTVTSIGTQAFQGHSGLTSITIPSSVTSIDGYSFMSCSGLTSITIEASTPPTLANANAFSNTNNCPIYVPAESVEAYKAANNWSTYASRIQAIPAQS